MPFDKSSQYCKPTAKQLQAPSFVSKHIYIAGLGHELGTTKEILISMFSRFGELNNELIELVEDRRYCYISYQNIDSAKYLMDVYHGIIKKPKKDDENQHEEEDSMNVLAKIRKLQLKYAILVSEMDYIPPNPNQPEPEDTEETKDIVIEGLRIIPDFISIEEEELLIESDIGNKDSTRWEELLSRRIQHYGMIFNYRTLMLDYVTNISPMPEEVLPLMPKMMDILHEYSSYCQENNETNANKKTPDELLQLTVNEYQPGQGIASHIDTDSCLGPDICVLSLLSDVVMAFQERRPLDPELAKTVAYYPSPAIVAKTILPKTSDKDLETDIPALEVVGTGCTSIAKRYTRRKYVHIPARSLLVLQGEARYNWSHGIAPRKYDKVKNEIIPRKYRLSLTFRQIMMPGDVPQNRLQSSHLELDHVFRVYDNIAVHWNHTRGKRKVHWHRVKDFVENLSKGSIVADIGSGDGKYFSLNPNAIFIGCDRSMKLLQVSHELTHETFCCDAVKLPLRTNSFDATICIAVMHHLASLDRRIATIRELLRITKVGGQVLIQAWALEQSHDSRWDFEGTNSSSTTATSTSTKASQQDVLVPWKLQQRFFQEGAIEEEFEDCEHALKGEDGSMLFQRYCHVYKKGELEDLCCSCPGNKILESGWDKGNWVVLLEKIDVTQDDNLLRNANIAPTGIMPRLATRL